MLSDEETSSKNFWHRLIGFIYFVNILSIFLLQVKNEMPVYNKCKNMDNHTVKAKLFKYKAFH
jgi:hypothetical protein